MRSLLLSLALVCFASGVAASSEPPKLAMPVNCELGKDCWVVNRVDVDPGPMGVDNRCDDHTYDTHKGVDIAIAGGSAMRRGVEVVAAAPGVVIGIRDEMPDADVTVSGRASVTGRECGNGVIVVSEDGWRHQYCHLRRGSVLVQQGSQVKTGDKLGFVGSSGLSQFPHLHLQVSRHGVFYDPDTGLALDEALCGQRGESIWEASVARALSDDGSAIYLSGFAPNVPQEPDARDGQYDSVTIQQDAAAFVVWFDIFRPDVGDKVEVKVTSPDGATIIERTLYMDKKGARRFFYLGKKRTTAAWPAGEYVAEIQLIRKDGTEKPSRRFSTMVEP